MTIKSILRLPVREALDATLRDQSSDLRAQIKKLVRKWVIDDAAKYRVIALLTRMSRVTDRRNELIHRPWALGKDSIFIVKDDDHEWTPPPTADDLNRLADEIAAVASELNEARLKGGYLYKALQEAKKAGRFPGPHTAPVTTTR